MIPGLWQLYDEMKDIPYNKCAEWFEANKHHARGKPRKKKRFSPSIEETPSERFDRVYEEHGYEAMMAAIAEDEARYYTQQKV